VHKLHVWRLHVTFVRMTNVRAIHSTLNSSPAKERRPEPACARSLNFLSGDRQAYALNLIRDWEAQMRHLEGLKGKSCKAHADNLFRLINHSGVAPWELKKNHVTAFLESRIDKDTGETLAPATVAVYFSGWRSFQNFSLELDRVNEILAHFKVRPKKFITDENGIAVKRHKANWVPKGWSLSPMEIEAVDEQFVIAIKQALAGRSKSLLPLQRDRVMFHIAIHFALRVSELVTVQSIDFRPSHDSRLACFGDLGVLTVTGKNDVTGSIPMREQDIYELMQWYLTHVRQRLLMRRKGSGDGTCKYDGKSYLTAQLLFPSERGGVINPNAFRKRLTAMAKNAGVIRQKLTPHTLRHTGCTLMVPIYSPEIAQKYMRHKNLYTTLLYYHPTPLDAANEVNTPLALFEDDARDED